MTLLPQFIRINVGWNNVEVEQRWYAHRARRSLLVHEVFVNNKANKEEQQLELSLNTMESPDLTAEMRHVEVNMSEYLF